MAEDYYWVVTCKNTGLHAEQNPFSGHRIPLGKTEANAPRPGTPDTIKVQCNDPKCSRTHSYEAADIIEWFGDPGAFSPHPLFV
jgi:hypothetical protein